MRYLEREVDTHSVNTSVSGVVAGLIMDEVVQLFNFDGRGDKRSLKQECPTLLNIMIGV